MASFEPQCGSGWTKLIRDDRWYVATGTVLRALDWPFQHGRSPWTMLLLTFAGISAICFAARRRLGVTLHAPRSSLHFRVRPLWRQAVALLSIAAFTFASTPNAEAVTYTPVFYYYHCDHLGSANVLTNRAGERVQHYECTSFGKGSFTDNTSAFHTSNLYTDQVLDEETGLYYYESRYYDPELGRFIQPDTIADLDDPQGLNPYSYVSNNPLNFNDPDGHGVNSPLDAELAKILSNDGGGVNNGVPYERIPGTDDVIIGDRRYTILPATPQTQPSQGKSLDTPHVEPPAEGV